MLSSLRENKSIVSLIITIILILGMLLFFMYGDQLDSFWFKVRSRFSSQEYLDSDSFDGQAIEPRDFKITEVTKTTARLEWKTDSPSFGFVLLGSHPDRLEIKYSPAEGQALKNYHVVELSNLIPGQKYYLVVSSNQVLYGRSGQPLEFITSF